MKLPRESRGRVMDKHVQTIDILPSIADALDFELPEKSDGQSALSDGLPSVLRRSASGPRPRRTEFKLLEIPFPLFLARRGAVVNQQASLFGTGSTRPGLLWAVGPDRELVGRPLASASLAGTLPASVRYDHPEELRAWYAGRHVGALARQRHDRRTARRPQPGAGRQRPHPGGGAHVRLPRQDPLLVHGARGSLPAGRQRRAGARRDGVAARACGSRRSVRSARRIALVGLAVAAALAGAGVAAASGAVSPAATPTRRRSTARARRSCSSPWTSSRSPRCSGRHGEIDARRFPNFARARAAEHVVRGHHAVRRRHAARHAGRPRPASSRQAAAPDRVATTRRSVFALLGRTHRFSVRSRSLACARRRCAAGTPLPGRTRKQKAQALRRPHPGGEEHAARALRSWPTSSRACGPGARAARPATTSTS